MMGPTSKLGPQDSALEGMRYKDTGYDCSTDGHRRRLVTVGKGLFLPQVLHGQGAFPSRRRRRKTEDQLYLLENLDEVEKRSPSASSGAAKGLVPYANKDTEHSASGDSTRGL